jgi:hypothetical protein
MVRSRADAELVRGAVAEGEALAAILEKFRATYEKHGAMTPTIARIFALARDLATSGDPKSVIAADLLYRSVLWPLGMDLSCVFALFIEYANEAHTEAVKHIKEVHRDK